MFVDLSRKSKFLSTCKWTRKCNYPMNHVKHCRFSGLCKTQVTNQNIMKTCGFILSRALLVASLLLLPFELLSAQQKVPSTLKQKPLVVLVIGVQGTEQHVWESLLTKLAELQGLSVDSRDKRIRAILFSERSYQDKVQRLKVLVGSSNPIDLYYEDSSYPSGAQHRYTDKMVCYKLRAFFNS